MKALEQLLAWRLGGNAEEVRDCVAEARITAVAVTFHIVLRGTYQGGTFKIDRTHTCAAGDDVQAVVDALVGLAVAEYAASVTAKQATARVDESGFVPRQKPLGDTQG